MSTEDRVQGLWWAHAGAGLHQARLCEHAVRLHNREDYVGLTWRVPQSSTVLAGCRTITFLMELQTRQGQQKFS